jgi:hypothetical protein
MYTSEEKKLHQTMSCIEAKLIVPQQSHRPLPEGGDERKKTNEPKTQRPTDPCEKPRTAGSAIGKQCYAKQFYVVVASLRNC